MSLLSKYINAVNKTANAKLQKPIIENAHKRSIAREIIILIFLVIIWFILKGNASELFMLAISVFICLQCLEIVIMLLKIDIWVSDKLQGIKRRVLCKKQ